MTPFEIALMVIRGVATLAHNPALGGGGVRPERASALLQMLATLLEGGESTWKELQAFAKEIDTMVKTTLEPSRAQWNAMEERHKNAQAMIAENKRILANKTALRAEMARVPVPVVDPPSPAAPTPTLFPSLGSAPAPT